MQQHASAVTLLSPHDGPLMGHISCLLEPVCYATPLTTTTTLLAQASSLSPSVSSAWHRISSRYLTPLLRKRGSGAGAGDADRDVSKRYQRRAATVTRPPAILLQGPAAAAAIAAASASEGGGGHGTTGGSVLTHNPLGPSRGVGGGAAARASTAGGQADTVVEMVPMRLAHASSPTGSTPPQARHHPRAVVGEEPHVVAARAHLGLGAAHTHTHIRDHAGTGAASHTGVGTGVSVGGPGPSASSLSGGPGEVQAVGRRGDNGGHPPRRVSRVERITRAFTKRRAPEDPLGSHASGGASGGRGERGSGGPGPQGTEPELRPSALLSPPSPPPTLSSLRRAAISRNSSTGSSPSPPPSPLGPTGAGSPPRSVGSRGGGRRGGSPSGMMVPPLGEDLRGVDMDVVDVQAPALTRGRSEGASSSTSSASSGSQ
jgi:hypothetical protein